MVETSMFTNHGEQGRLRLSGSGLKCQSILRMEILRVYPRDFDSANLRFGLDSAFLLSALGDSDAKGPHELNALKTVLLNYLLYFLSVFSFELLCFFLLS